MNAATYPLNYIRRKAISTALKYKVFIVEDNNTCQMMLENYLTKMPNLEQDKKPNLEIHTFETGKECLEAMYMKPNIVILDYYLDENNPDAENGLVILKKIKDQYPSTKVIVMSGQESVMVTAELFNKGASDYISKEHYGIVRVGQSVLRVITEIEAEKKLKNKIVFINLIMLVVGVLIGLFL